MLYNYFYIHVASIGLYSLYRITLTTKEIELDILDVSPEIIEYFKKVIERPSSQGEMVMVSDLMDDSFHMTEVE